MPHARTAPIAVSIALLFASLLLAQEPAKPAPKGEKDAKSGGAAVKSSEARAKQPKAGEAPEGKGLDAKEKGRFKNQIRRRLQQSDLQGAWDLAEKAYQQADGLSHRDLRAFAAWAMAVMQGQCENKEECLRWFDEAIKNGWENASSFEYSSLVQMSIRESAEFKERVKKLRDKHSAALASEVEAKVKKASDPAAAKEQFTLPESAYTEGGYRREALSGRPALVIVTRMHHEGFSTIIETLNRAYDDFAATIPMAVLFYQYRADDQESLLLTKGYAEHEKLKLPYGVVDRGFVKPLDLPYFPTFFFLDAEAKVVFRHQGLIDDAYLRVVLKTLAESAPKPAPPPEPKPTPKEEPTAAKPAEPEPPPAKPEEPKPETAKSEPAPEEPKKDDEKPEAEPKDADKPKDEAKPEPGDEAKPAEEPKEGSKPEGGAKEGEEAKPSDPEPEDAKPADEPKPESTPPEGEKQPEAEKPGDDPGEKPASDEAK